MENSVILVSFCCFLVGYIVFNKRKHQNKSGQGPALPPGPKGKPLVGNLLDIPPIHSWFQFEKWGLEYGPLCLINIAGRKHMIISKESIAQDLLRERGNIYSSREQQSVAAKLLSDHLRPLLLPYDAAWRNGRKLMNSLLNSRVAPSYEPIQEEESLRVVHDLLRQPDDYETWIERYSAGVILRVAYSKYVFNGKERYVKRIMDVVHNLERIASPGAYLADILPFMFSLPDWLAPFKREVKALHAEELDLFKGLIQDVESKMETGELQEENFASKWSRTKDRWGLSDDSAAYAIGTLFEAGAGTTSVALLNFILAMTLYPEALKKLQQELDEVVGPNRLPCFADLENLPRVRAVAKEVLRWRPVSPGGVPHMSTADDVYELPSGKQVFIPAGTTLHPVSWAIYNDKEMYPRPTEFIPERWLEPEWTTTYREPLSKYPNMQNFSAFGFGRRICPGLNIAERSLYINISRIAWACTISKAKDANGEEITPPLFDYTAGFVVGPKKFPFALTAREGREKIVSSQWDGIWGAKTRESAAA